MTSHEELIESILEAAGELRDMFSSTEYPDGLVRNILEGADNSLWQLVEDLNDDFLVQEFIESEGQ